MWGKGKEGVLTVKVSTFEDREEKGWLQSTARKFKAEREGGKGQVYEKVQNLTRA